MQQAIGKQRGCRSSSLGKCEESAPRGHNEGYIAPLLPPLLPHSICTARDARNHAILVLEALQETARCGSDVAGPHCALLPS